MGRDKEEPASADQSCTVQYGKKEKKKTKMGVQPLVFLLSCVSTLKESQDVLATPSTWERWQTLHQANAGNQFAAEAPSWGRTPLLPAHSEGNCPSCRWRVSVSLSSETERKYLDCVLFSDSSHVGTMS